MNIEALTWAEAIEASANQNRIVHLEATEATCLALLGNCDGDVQVDDSEHQYWGKTDAGDEWRVHTHGVPSQNAGLTSVDGLRAAVSEYLDDEGVQAEQCRKAMHKRGWTSYESLTKAQVGLIVEDIRATVYDWRTDAGSGSLQASSAAEVLRMLIEGEWWWHGAEWDGACLTIREAGSDTPEIEIDPSRISRIYP